MGSHSREGGQGLGEEPPALRIDAEPFETLAETIADEPDGEAPRIVRWMDTWTSD
jgi:hypothetical protein